MRFFILSPIKNSSYHLESPFMNKILLHSSCMGVNDECKENWFFSSSPKNVLCQVWLKLAQWFWRRKWKCEKFKDRGIDGQKVVGKAHFKSLDKIYKNSSLELLYIKKSRPDKINESYIKGFSFIIIMSFLIGQ